MNHWQHNVCRIWKVIFEASHELKISRLPRIANLLLFAKQELMELLAGTAFDNSGLELTVKLC
jgi:hypothetical protein